MYIHIEIKRGEEGREEGRREGKKRMKKDRENVLNY